MDISTYKVIGAAGLLLISLGILLKNRRRQDILFIIGGACLEIYSAYLRDTIFTLLQIVFILSALYDLQKEAKRSALS